MLHSAKYIVLGRKRNISVLFDSMILWGILGLKGGGPFFGILEEQFV